jgi:hypothetical protein
VKALLRPFTGLAVKALATRFDPDPAGFENRGLAFLARWIGDPGS